MVMPEPEGYLNNDELEQWRHIQANIDALVDNPEAHSLGESRSVHFDKYVFLGGIWADRRLSPTAEVIINPISGAIYQAPIEIEVEE